jgi:glycosyltransferase involved in cell wall biosynthesis
MGSGYDLMTIIQVAARWKAEAIFPAQIHFAGEGPQRPELEAKCQKAGLLASPPSSSLSLSGEAATARVVFHGFLHKEAITELLLSADLALVPNRPSSLVACPYKAGEYAAAGLPMLSCLGGELGKLIQEWNAGSEYNEGDVDSLDTAFKNTSEDLNLLEEQSLNARKMAEALFDRSRTYPKLAEFIIT